MKKLIFVAAAFLPGICSIASAQNAEGDTVIVKMKNKNKIHILVDKENDLNSLKGLSFEKIMMKIDSSMGNLDSMMNMDIELIKDNQGRKSEIRIGKTLRISEDSDMDNPMGEQKMVKVIIRDGDTIRKETIRRRTDKKPEVRFMKFSNEDVAELDLGFNNYLENGSLPSDNGAKYGLLPVNSNIVNLRLMTRIGRKPGKTRLSGSVGMEFSWNNYKFDQNSIIGKDSMGVTFNPFPAGQKKIKSKLTVAWVNVPLMLHYHALKSSFHLAIGGFAGYRLGSHNKIKFSEDGAIKKEKEYTNFYLNSLQYGLRFQVGFYDVDFFASYNLNQLFAKGKGPQLTPVSFGVTF